MSIWFNACKAHGGIWLRTLPTLNPADAGMRSLDVAELLWLSVAELERLGETAAGDAIQDVLDRLAWADSLAKP